ncbi:MAG TPA: PIG-L family deacetylase [Bryobacteraceae bacterium]|nr:PIG-L family deacetylase [Bryobacteraceae bacterium]
MTFGKRLSAAVACAALAAASLYSLRGADRGLVGTPAIRFELDKLNVLGSVLMIGAHPDDENTAVIAYLARGRKIRTGYLSLTRGEGGQNLIGDEQGEALGVLRTQELLAARQVDGASQYFTRAIDFGFTKTPAETLEKWGHDRILSDIVWVIRQQQPDVILLCFTGTAADGHGQHQVSAILGREAFDAAADPKKFPEQLKWVKPWQAKRVMQARFTPPSGGPPVGGGARGASGASGGGRGAPLGRGASGASGPQEKVAFTLPVGDYDPVIGKSYRAIAVESRDQHRSQGMVQLTTYGELSTAFVLRGGAPAAHDLMDGIDTTWSRLPGGARVGELLARARNDFDDLHPEKTVPALLEARAAVGRMADAGQQWAKWKRDEIDQAIALCTGLHVEAEANEFGYTPGAAVDVKLTVVNRSHLPMVLADARVTGWGEADAPVKNAAAHNLSYNREDTVDLKLTVPKNEPPSQPFWLEHPPSGDTYTIPDQALIGRADIVPQVTVRFDFTVNGQLFSETEPLHYRYADPSRGEFVRPVVVEPPLSVELPARNIVAPEGTTRDISVLVRAMSGTHSTEAAGELVFDAPEGWSVEPSKAAFDLKEADGTQEVKFRLTPPSKPGTGDFKVEARLNGGKTVATTVDMIDYTHIPAQTIFETSGGKISAVDLKVLAKRVGYVMGSADKMPEAIRQMGCQVDLLDDKTLTSGDLSVYDAIVTGLRAYAVRADLRAAQSRILDYVNRGGTLVVQYNRLDDRRISPSVSEAFDHLGPYPFTLSQGNTERVTEEDAPVKILDPNSTIVRGPNAITEADFRGWVQERGVYFAESWDPKYQAPFETHDTGEKDLKGALLYARFGKGAYIYTSFSWFRELPAGVPGAFRIFANLLSAGNAGGR